MSATTAMTALQIALLLSNPNLTPLQLATSVALAGVGEGLQRHVELCGFDDNSDTDVQGLGEFLSCFIGPDEPLNLGEPNDRSAAAGGFAYLLSRALAKLPPCYLDAIREEVAPASPRVEN